MTLLLHKELKVQDYIYTVTLSRTGAQYNAQVQSTRCSSTDKGTKRILLTSEHLK